MGATTTQGTGPGSAEAGMKGPGNGRNFFRNSTDPVTIEIVGGFTGDVTGDVIGSLTGNVAGNVLGNLTGNVTGDVTGDLTGNVTGDVTGDLTGNVTGNIVGEVASGSIVVRANGIVSFGTSTLVRSENNIIVTLPTVDPVVAGALWIDGATLKVSAGA